MSKEIDAEKKVPRRERYHQTHAADDTDPYRHLYLIQCEDGFECDHSDCVKIHGESEAKQAQQRQKYATTVVCIYHLFGCCDRFDSGTCRYRHFVRVQELTAPQQAEFEHQLSKRSTYPHEERKHVPPLVIQFQPGLSERGPLIQGRPIVPPNRAVR